MEAAGCYKFDRKPEINHNFAFSRAHGDRIKAALDGYKYKVVQI
jgi:hypothetical protein